MKTILVLAASTVAVAASPTVAAPTNGARAEVIVGLDSAHLDSFGNRDDPSESGIVYGIGAGYDFAVTSGLSVGVDVEASHSDARFHFVSGPDDNSYRLGRDLYVGARITTSITDSVNLYAKAGYTNLSTRLDLINPTFPEVIEVDEGGARVGAGLQIALSGRMYVGTEYRFSTYDELDRHQGVAALGIRF